MIALWCESPEGSSYADAVEDLKGIISEQIPVFALYTIQSVLHPASPRV